MFVVLFVGGVVVGADDAADIGADALQPEEWGISNILRQTTLEIPKVHGQSTKVHIGYEI